MEQQKQEALNPVEDEQLTADSNEVLTEVTSIAKEEAKTGEKVPIPTPEELAQRAAIGHMQNLRVLEAILNSGKLSSKAKNRVIIAILSLPTGKIPVKLKTDEEKMAFAYGQRAINDRFLVTQHYINLEVQRLRTESAAKAAQPTEISPSEVHAATTEAVIPVDPNANTSTTI